MPIKGLTDRGVAFPQIGNIRKGGKKVQATDKSTGKPRFDERGNPVMIQGKDLPYFRVEIDENDTYTDDSGETVSTGQRKKTADKFTEIYGDQPTAIVIILPFDDIDRVWHAWREAYTAGALQHRCDGEYTNYEIDPRSGEIVIKNGVNAQGERVKCNRQYAENKNTRCKPTGRLHVIIPQLERLAYLVVHTTSIHDIGNISDQLAAIREMNNGHIAGIPLVMRRRPVEISMPSGPNGQRARRVKYLISIEADPEWVAAKLSAMRAAALPHVDRLQIQAAPLAGPEWSELGDDEDDDAEPIEADPVESTEKPAEQHQPEPQTVTEQWPQDYDQFCDWMRAHGYNGKVTRQVFGMEVREWLKQNPIESFETAAMNVKAVMSDPAK